MTKYLKLCPVCRRKLRPRGTNVVGAWWCVRCERAFSQLEVEEDVRNQPGGIDTIGPRRKP